MKIAWVTPFNQRSAIGKVSASITAALSARGHDITIIGSEHDPYDPTPRHASTLPFFHWRDRDPAELQATHDAIIVNIGDNYGFHAGVVDYVGRSQCIGIFHDFCIYHLFTGWLDVHRYGPDIRERELDVLYGPGSGEAMRRFFSSSATLIDIVTGAPMTEWMSRRCGGALAHANFYLPQLREACPGPTAMSYLTQTPRDIPTLASHDGGLVVTTVGWINFNKCADVVIEAIAGSANLKANCRYRLVGPIPSSERSRLLGIAQSHGYDRLDIVGEVDEPTLDKELARADILCCLRRPILEGASASAIEAMMSGRPVIVADAGFYGELPTEHVVKVSQAVPVSEVRQALESLADDEAKRRTIGAGAKAWALGQFNRDRYVMAVEALVKEFVAVRPYLSVSRVVGRNLMQMGLSSEDPAVDRIANTMQALFSPDKANCDFGMSNDTEA